MLALGVGNAWGENAPVNTVLWGENFAHFGTKTPSDAKTGTGTTIYDGASITYTQSSTNTKAYNEKLAGGTAPELLLSKSNQTWTISGIKTGGATKMALTFLSNKTTFNVTVSSASLSVSGSQKSWTITLKDGQTVPETFDLTIKNTGSSNERIDNVELKVTVAGTNTEPVTTYSVTLNQPANGTISATGLTDGKAAGGTIVKLTATPDASYKWESWTVTGASGDVAVSNNQFTMPAEDVTVTASFVAKTQYTIKWNVAEGSVADTKVYEGDALGTLPTADNCSSGKVFVGWTEAASVNADGSGLVLAKSTDVPAGNKEYNAVYATLSGSADKVDNLDLSLTGASGSTYSSWSGKKSVSDAVYAGNSAGGNDAIQLRKSSDSQAKSGIITTTSGGKAKKVVVTWNSNTASGRTLNVYGSNSAYSSVDNLYTDATAGTLIGTIVNGTSTELDITGDYEYIGMRSNASAMYLDKIQITWSASSASDYSLDCGTNNTPFLTVTETPIDFGTVAQNETVTKTFTVTGGYLAEDVALTISGTDASFFSVSPATITKADDVEETVTVTYNPTATGDHTATLTIKSGDITKTVALSGTVLAPGKWVLVKNVTELSAGDEVIIASSISNYAIGTAASNNYKGAAITKVGETANTTAEVTILTVEETGVAEAPYAFKTDGKYLYAAGSDKNYLRAQATNNENGQWAVAITEGVASIVAAKSENHNVMQFNPNNGSPIFACYETASQKALAIYRNSENVAKPIISGEANFVGSTQVTITAKSGLTVYYTTDDSTPDKTATQYNAPFTISATTTVKAIAYDATDNASPVAEMTFTKQELVNVATAMALAKDEIAYFDEFEVVKVVAGKGNIYIKDASGHGLIYDNTLAGQLKDGDRVQGFVGVSSPYNGLPEAKPYNVTYADLTITAGTAAEPYDFTSIVIAETDINKYIVFQDVEVTTNTDMSSNPTLTIGGNNVKFYNQFGVSKTLEAGKTYDIYGFVAVYEKDGSRSLQVYFYEAVQDGEVIQKYTVTYNAGGATGTVPVDNAEYSEGAQVYLKSATGLTYEGYEYKGWKVTDANGTEIPVSSNKFNMPASNVTVTAQWEEIVVTPRRDFSEGYWVLVTDASELADKDYIIVAAADENYAMKSYESGNNCEQLEIVKKYENKLLEWTSEIGVFQLAANGTNYTIQDVNSNHYLYAAGTGTKNYLKAANEVPADAEAAKPYIWTISYTDGVATVKATSENRNTLMYNTGSDLFSCYASGQKDIALYKYVSTLPTYTVSATANPAEGGNITGAATYELGATVTLTATANEGYVFVNWKKGEETVSSDATYTFTATEDITLVANFEQTTPIIPTITLTTGDNSAVIAANIGKTVNVKIERSFTANDGYYTLCVPFNMPAEVIGKAYSLGTITEHVSGQGININLEEKFELSASMPYLVLPKANMSELVVENVTILEDPVAGQGVSNDELNVQIFFQGYYSAPGVTTNGTTEYYVGNNGYLYNGEVEIRGLSGLFTITDKETNPINIRARVVAGENGVTSVEDIITNAAPQKVIENGQLIIIRDGVKYNVQGQVIK